MTCGFNKTNLLRDKFGEHFISRSRPVKWSPRLCDLTPLGYFFVYTDEFASIDALEDNIEAFIHRYLPKC